MCGICGIRRFREVPINKDAIDLLILNNQNRGLEAAGIALQQVDGSVQIHKNNLTPYEFVTSMAYNEFMAEYLKEDTVTAIGHTRKATKGNPKVIANNHPMFQGNVAVVHNGVIHNDDTMFNELKLERKCETDSDIIRAILDKEGFTHKAINLLSRLSGNAAFAAISPKYPGKLLLARSGNTVELLGTADFLFFSSERGPLYKAIRPYRRVWGISMREMTPLNYFMIGMNDNSAWLFADKAQDQAGGQDYERDWLEWHQEMKIAVNYTAPNYTCTAQFHGQRMKFYDDRPIDVVMCPGCKNYIVVNQAVLKDLKNYECKYCNASLA